MFMKSCWFQTTSLNQQLFIIKNTIVTVTAASGGWACRMTSHYWFQRVACLRTTGRPPPLLLLQRSQLVATATAEWLCHSCMLLLLLLHAAAAAAACFFCCFCRCLCYCCLPAAAAAAQCAHGSSTILMTPSRRSANILYASTPCCSGSLCVMMLVKGHALLCTSGSSCCM